MGKKWQGLILSSVNGLNHENCVFHIRIESDVIMP